jgi:hypothetical protein
MCTHGAELLIKQTCCVQLYKKHNMCCCMLQVVTILVKGDTVDVNVAGIQRMSPQAWAAAADIFERELAGVQLLQQQQVRCGCPAQQVYNGSRCFPSRRQ